MKFWRENWVHSSGRRTIESPLTLTCSSDMSLIVSDVEMKLLMEKYGVPQQKALFPFIPSSSSLSSSLLFSSSLFLSSPLPLLFKWYPSGASEELSYSDIRTTGAV